MSARSFAWVFVPLYVLWTAGLAAAAPAELTPEAAAARLVGTWDATPALDEDVLRADPSRDVVHARASAIGVRMVCAFDRDGSMTIVTLRPSGQNHPGNADRLVLKRVEARWSVGLAGGEGKGRGKGTGTGSGKRLSLRIARGDAKASEHALAFEGEDAFRAEVYDLQHLAFRSPFLFRRNVGERALSWIRTHHAAGRPNAALAKDMSATVTALVNKQQDFCIRLGPGLTKSGRATQLLGFCEQLTVQELSEPEAEYLKLRGLAVSVIGWPRQSIYPVPSEARVSDGPHFDAPGGRLDLSKPLTGHVTFDTLNPLPPAQYTARFTFLMDRALISLFQPTLPGQQMLGKWTFSVKMPEKHAGYAGPLVVFADVCRETKFAHGEFTMEVLSPAAVVHLQARDPAAAPE